MEKRRGRPPKYPGPHITAEATLSDELIEQFGGDTHAAMEHRRAEAKVVKARTGSYPLDWDTLITTHTKMGGNKPQTPEEFLKRARLYFEWIQMRQEDDPGRMPLMSEFALAMTFPNHYAMGTWIRKHPEMANVHALCMTLLTVPIEEALSRTGVNTRGLIFRITNIPEGWEPTEASDAPIRYPWKERRQSEVVGVDGQALAIQTTNMTPEEVYAAMMKRGARLDQATEPAQEWEPVPELGTENE